MLKYKITLQEDDNDSFMVTVPAFPEVATFGNTVDEAKLNAARAIQEAIAARISDREDIPEADGGEVALPTAIQLKTELYREMRRSKKRPADLVRALGWRRNQVDRLFKLDHQTRLDQFDQAFNALGKELKIETA